MSRFMSFASQVVAGITQVRPGSSSIPKGGQKLAIDLGSTRTRIKVGSKLIFDQASCIAVHPGSGSVLAVGEAAYHMLGKGSDQVQVIFPIRRGKVANLVAAQHFLATALQPILPAFKLLQPLLFRELVMAVPANSTPAQRSFFRQALLQAGYFHLTYQSKTLAVAKVVRSHKPQLQIDIGGQTTEVAICQNGEVLVKKTIGVGGDDFTQSLIQSIRSVHMCEVGWQTAEKIKAEIGLVTLKRAQTEPQPTDLLTVVRGKDVVTNLPKTIQLKSSEVTKEVSTLANSLLLEVREVCDLAPAELLAQALEEGIYFTGGGSQLKNLGIFLAHGMMTQPLFAKTPLLDVIKGLS